MLEGVGERPWGRDAMTYEPGSMNAINISCVICHVLGGMWGTGTVCMSALRVLYAIDGLLFIG